MFEKVFFKSVMRNILTMPRVRQGGRYETETSKKCVCFICNRTFNSTSLVKLHLRVAHKEKFRFKCNVCGEVITDSKKAAQHIHYFVEH